LKSEAGDFLVGFRTSHTLVLVASALFFAVPFGTFAMTNDFTQHTYVYMHSWLLGSPIGGFTVPVSRAYRRTHFVQMQVHHRSGVYPRVSQL
jgi:hypothetical protein